MSPTQFHDVVSGRQKGPRAVLLRTLLSAAEIPYTAAVRWRNARYDAQKKPIEKVSVPVVSVGNLTLGGTGKTPMVEWLSRWMRAQNVRVTWISRGYGAKRGAPNDEALELEQRLPDVPHLENPDRVAAARTAVEEFECQCIVLDDGFQHRRLARDLDIVLIDALEPFGFEHVFPRGTLREPLTGLARAHVVALARADMVQPSERERIRAIVKRYAPLATWIEVIHAPRKLIGADGREEPVASLVGKRWGAFCGIGNPVAFRHTLEACGAQLVGWREFADHYAYERADVERLSRWADEIGVDALVCTHKDLVKLRTRELGRYPLWALGIELQILVGQSELEARLRPLVEQARAG